MASLPITPGNRNEDRSGGDGPKTKALRRRRQTWGVVLVAGGVAASLALFIPSCKVMVPPVTQVTFQCTYGDSEPNMGYSVLQTADGGYAIAGCTVSESTTCRGIRLIKTDESGDTIWMRTYGASNSDKGWSVAQTTDGGYVIAGCAHLHGIGRYDAWLIRADAFGDIMWARVYGGMYDDEGYSVAQTTDGGYVIAGYTTSDTTDLWDAYLVKTDASGGVMWTRTFGGANSDCGNSVTQTADGGYIIVGYTTSFGAEYCNAWLIKTNASGDTVWTRTFGGRFDDWGNSVVQTTDGGYVITGETKSFGAGQRDAWLIKTDASGDTVWTRTYGGESDDWGESVAQTADGGYIIAGSTVSYGAGSIDVLLIRTDASGDTMWTRTFGGPNIDCGYSVAQTADGGYVIGGHTASFGEGEQDAWLIKTDSTGRVAIAGP